MRLMYLIHGHIIVKLVNIIVSECWTLIVFGSTMKGEFIVYFRFLAVVWGQNTSVLNCIHQSDGSTMPLNAHVQGCYESTCLVPQLEDFQMQIQFGSSRDLHRLRTEVYAYIIGGVPVPYHLGPEAVTCRFLDCPLMAQEVVTYTLRMDIGSWMPIGSTFYVEILIRNEEGRSVVMCLRLPIRIRNSIGEPRSAVIDSNETGIDFVDILDYLSLTLRSTDTDK